MAQFQQMFIAAACDYLKNAKGIGIQPAFEMRADNEYYNNFIKAMAVFNHQCLIWNAVALFHLQNGTLNHLWIFSTSVESIPFIFANEQHISLPFWILSQLNPTYNFHNFYLLVIGYHTAQYVVSLTL